jgi:hypothetical protein
MQNRLLTFDQALTQSASGKRHLLLGNGFSIALFPQKFVYKSLLEQADFSQIPLARQAFDRIKTTDFESVIWALKNAAQLLPLYQENQQVACKMQEDAEKLKEILVQAIAGNHPSNPSEITEENFWACRQFLAHFISKKLDKQKGHVYTLNYDLLTYWALMHDEDAALPENEQLQLDSDDGFRAPDDDDYEIGLISDYVTWNGEFAHSQNIHYLHGALHLFDNGAELKKFCWERSGGKPLMDQVRSALAEDKYPVFVSEGDSSSKLAKIRHNAFLQRSLKSLGGIQGSLFVYGHSLAPNDDHIFNTLLKGKITNLFISIYGDPMSMDNKKIIARANALAGRGKPSKPLNIYFYDAASANVWGKS